MIKRIFKLSYAAALLFAGLTLAPMPASAGGCGAYGCEQAAVEPAPVVVYQPSCSCCGCGGGSYYYSYAPANTYPSAYYGYAEYGYAGYGYAGAAYRASVAPYAYANRFYRPRAYVGPRRAWVR